MKQIISRLLASLVIVWTILPQTVIAEINICSSCGYEYDQGDGFCSHCGKKLAVSVPGVAKNPATGTMPSEGESPDLGVPNGLLENEMITIQEHMRNQQPWHALRVARNAKGLSMLGTVPDVATREKLAVGINKLEQGLSKRATPCAFCQGRGYPMALSLSMRGDKQTTAVPHIPCQACGGSKVLMTAPPPDVLATEASLAQRDVDTAFRTRGWKETMGIWIPPALDLLNAEAPDKARVLRAVGQTCTTCQGIGRLGCEDCHGQGKVPCGNKECVAGMEVCRKCDGTRMENDRRDSRTVKQTCTHCQGRGIAPCEDCEGRGYEVCEDCKGLGDIACEDCDGKGHPPTCEDCRGNGVADCHRCRGTGVYRDRPCTECEGKKKVLCEECHGTGQSGDRRRRR